MWTLRVQEFTPFPEYLSPPSLPLSLSISISPPSLPLFLYLSLLSLYLYLSLPKLQKQTSIMKTKKKKKIIQSKQANDKTHITKQRKIHTKIMESVLLWLAASGQWSLPWSVIDIYPVTLHCRKLVFPLLFGELQISSWFVEDSMPVSFSQCWSVARIDLVQILDVLSWDLYWL